MIFVFQALRERQRFRSTVVGPTKFNPICVSSTSVHKLTSGRASRYNGNAHLREKSKIYVRDSGRKWPRRSGKRNPPRYPPRGICSFSSTCFFMTKLRLARSKSVLRVNRQANAPSIRAIFIKLCNSVPSFLDRDDLVHFIEMRLEKKKKVIFDPKKFKSISLLALASSFVICSADHNDALYYFFAFSC